MLEILFVFLLVQRASKLAKAKGRRGTWSLLIPAMWIGFEVPVLIAALLLLGSSDLGDAAVYVAAGAGLVGGGIGGAIAFAIVRGLEPVAGSPGATAVAAPVYGAPAVPASAQPAFRLAGYCATCGANVWLAPDGSCCAGHPASQVSGVYSSPAT